MNKKHGLQYMILNELRKKWWTDTRWYNSQSIQDYFHRQENGFNKHESTGRALRKLRENGLIEDKKDGEAQSVYYRYLPSRHEELSKVMKSKC